MASRRQQQQIAAMLTAEQADYRAAKRSGAFRRNRRGVPSLGAGADYHYRSESDYLWLGEAARDLDRNDMVIGQIIDRVVSHTVRDGFRPNPDTGDQALNLDLVARWDEEAADPSRCDASGQHCFTDLERLMLRERLVAGDVFALPIDNGTIQLVEFHRCRSPKRASKQNDRIVHGIEYANETRRRLRYWFTSDPIDPFKQVDRKDLTPRPAYDTTGAPLVWHHYLARRPSQTRGVTALAPIFDAASYHDDIHFATLLKQQLSAFFMILRNRSESYFGVNSTPAGVTRETTDGRLLDEVAPGAEITSNPGETISAWSPNIPSGEWFKHMRLILQILGANLGLPLVMVLMDGSETNFSGYRGAVEEARAGFRSNQQLLIRQFHMPAWRWRLNRWADADPSLRRLRAANGSRYFKHTWDPPAWPYIQPVEDATADLIRHSNMLDSPSHIHKERGQEWSKIVEDTINDRSLAIEKAATKAREINARLGLDAVDAIRWRDLAPLPAPERVAVSRTESTSTEPTNTEPTNATPE